MYVYMQTKFDFTAINVLNLQDTYLFLFIALMYLLHIQCLITWDFYLKLLCSIIQVIKCAVIINFSYRF